MSVIQMKDLSYDDVLDIDSALVQAGSVLINTRLQWVPVAARLIRNRFNGLSVSEYCSSLAWYREWSA